MGLFCDVTKWGLLYFLFRIQLWDWAWVMTQECAYEGTDKPTEPEDSVMRLIPLRTQCRLWLGSVCWVCSGGVTGRVILFCRLGIAVARSCSRQDDVVVLLMSGITNVISGRGFIAGS